MADDLAFLSDHAISSVPQWYSKKSFVAGTHSLGTGNAGLVTAEFDIKPLQNNIDCCVGYTGSSVDPTAMGDLCMILAMDPDGTFKVRDYDQYVALTEVPYSANNTYHVKMVADTANSKYSIWITPPGGTETMIAQDYRFRNNGLTINDVGYVSIYSYVADNLAFLSGHAISSVPQWYSKKAFVAGTHSLGTGNEGLVTTEFDVKPLQNNIDCCVGYTGSSVDPTAMGDLCMILAMDPDGTFKVRDYNQYVALAEVTYSANNVYHVKMVADTTSSIYSVWITPPGGTETMIARDYRFRNNGLTIDDVGYLSIYSYEANDLAYLTNHTIEAAPAPDYTLSFGGENVGGAGKARTITIGGSEADNLDGKYLVVQFTEGEGVNAKVSVIMISPESRTVTVSYQLEGTEVEAWLASDMPDLTAEDMGVTVFAHAGTGQ